MGLIYLDACILIYAFEGAAELAGRVKSALASQAPEKFAISPLVKFECLVAPMRSGNLMLQRYYEEGFTQFQLLEMPEDVFLLGAQLRARFGLKPPDALHLATAQYHRCEALWTNDSRLQKAAHGLALDVIHE